MGHNICQSNSVENAVKLIFWDQSSVRNVKVQEHRFELWISKIVMKSFIIKALNYLNTAVIDSFSQTTHPFWQQTVLGFRHFLVVIHFSERTPLIRSNSRSSFKIEQREDLFNSFEEAAILNFSRVIRWPITGPNACVLQIFFEMGHLTKTLPASENFHFPRRELIPGTIHRTVKINDFNSPMI